jgi:hypothetical protein
MIGALSAALISLDRICETLASAIQSSEPQSYGSIVVAVLFWLLMFPPKDDPDEI